MAVPKELHRVGAGQLFCLLFLSRFLLVLAVNSRFSDGGSAAEIALSGTAITRLSLRFRQYSASGEMSLLLPLRQTLAIAAEHPGTELSVGYADSGGDTVSASWLAD